MFSRKGGIKIKNREGDKITPRGIFQLVSFYIDKTNGNFVTKLEKVKIKEIWLV